MNDLILRKEPDPIERDSRLGRFDSDKSIYKPIIESLPKDNVCSLGRSHIMIEWRWKLEQENSDIAWNELLPVLNVVRFE